MWVNGKRNGWGKNYQLNGEFYHGPHLNDKYEGEGKFYTKEGKARYFGPWKQSKKCGYGV